MSRPLRIDLERLRHGDLNLEFSLPVEDFDLAADPDFTFHGPVAGALTAHLVGGESVQLAGRLSVRATSQCVLCLEPLEYPLDLDVRVFFMPNPPGREMDGEFADEDKMYFVGDTVYPKEMLREEIMVALPLRPACADEDACRARKEALLQRAAEDPGARAPSSEEGAARSASPWQSELAKVRDRLSPDDSASTRDGRAGKNRGGGDSSNG